MLSCTSGVGGTHTLSPGCLFQVIINFPDPAQKSDIVQLRGPKNEVEKCTKYMQKMVADLVGLLEVSP